MDASDRAFFSSYGLESTLKELDKTPSLVPTLKHVIAASGLPSADKTTGTMLFNIAVQLPDPRAARREYLAKAVAGGAFASAAQLTSAIDYLKKRAPDAAIDEAEFKAACGYGIRFSDEDIQARAADVIGRHREELLAQRYVYNLISLLTEARDGNFKWADGGKLKAAVDAAVLGLLGPKTADDEKREAEAKEAKKAAGKKAAAPAPAAAAAAAAAAATPAVAAAAPAGGAPATSSGAAAIVAGQTENKFVGRELAAAVNSPELIAAHKTRTSGKIRTRFPPEPNGFLHIGHAKSMNLNFEGAFVAIGVNPATDGETIFRYDDTNPEAEDNVYIESQALNVAWLGWKPVRVTHSSDYFPQLYEFAIRLIKQGDAYVCHQTKDEVEASREIARLRDGRNPNSPWRDRPIEENLREFEAMKNGAYEEGKATLRLKIDMTSDNPTMWDPVAYRIRYKPHPVTKDQWCIYPSYDYSHCLIDSLEDIDYSLCTLEFEIRRDLYYWTLERLNLYRPYVWEFSRLNITHTMLSKRKILKLVMEKRVRGWDDPRIATLNGLRRRGYTPQAINAFCRAIGVTRVENTVTHATLEHYVREHLDTIAPRAFAVLRPLKITLVNVPDDYLTWVEAPDFPRDKSLGMHKIAVSKVVYIERDDFREVDHPDYYGLAPGKTAGLRYAGYVTVVDVVKDAAGTVVELKCEYDAERAKAGKVKGNLHWVSSSTPGAEPATAEVRLYDHLFFSEDPANVPDWEADINPNSEVVLKGCYIDASLAVPGKHAVFDHFQFERQGFFVVDPDSDTAAGKYVFNLTVSLKEDTKTKAVRGKAPAGGAA